MLRGWLTGLALIACAAAAPAGAATDGTAYDYGFTSIEGGPLPLSQYRGKAVLVVNTASRCGYTPQYEGLQALWERYRDRGLVVLGVPSGDFGGQELATEAEIKQFCEATFNIDFPLAEKTIVSGDAAHPFYAWAAQTLGEEARPRWNFHKYLVSRNGRLIDWFPTRTEPGSERVTAAIEAALSP